MVSSKAVKRKLPQKYSTSSFIQLKVTRCVGLFLVRKKKTHFLVPQIDQLDLGIRYKANTGRYYINFNIYVHYPSCIGHAIA
jgi:hypothetical protein